MRIGMIGSGLMGCPMAIRLLKAGHQVTIWNRTLAKTKPVAAAGATVVQSPYLVAADAELVLVILENGPVVADVIFKQGVREAMARGTVLVDLSSVAPWIAREHAELLAGRGVDALDSPVSGGPSGAEAGTLAIMAGGSLAAFRTAEPVLSSLGRPTHVGPAGAGQIAKLCSQIVTASALNAVSDMLIFAAAGGADPARVRDALSGGFADSKVLQIHGRRMLERNFEPGGHVRTFLKDLEAATRIADAEALNLPALMLAYDSMKRHADAGFGEEDIASIIRAAITRNPRIQLG
jgi:2-hydroxy-3-oxopropionate reductase